MLHHGIAISSAAASKPAGDGVLVESLLTQERRSKKVGILPTKARLVLEAARRCLDPGLSATAGARDRVGVSLGTLFGSMDSAELCLLTPRNGGFGHVMPSWYATGLPNATAAIVASLHDMQGPNLTVLGYQAGIEAIIMACRQILAGRASAMLAGGFDLPSERFVAWLRDAAVYAEARAIHPGVGLVWLSAAPEARAAVATIVGWSQAFVEPDAVAPDQFRALIAAAAKGRALDHEPVIHLLYPGRKGLVDHLAATAPIHLVETIIEREPLGLHALIVKGFGASAACLLVDKHA
jgi:3-oxoacyl-[acyl-carrier-protein] synthase II